MSRCLHGLCNGTGLRDNLYVLTSLQQRLKALAKQGVVVGDNQACAFLHVLFMNSAILF